MPFYSPLRYPGGKGRLGPWLADVVRANGLCRGAYAEPYAGGAGAALHLLLGGHISEIELNDADRRIFAFWYSILTDADAFIRRVRQCSLCIEEWQRQRTILEKYEEYSLFEVGFAAFYLNRCNRSGVISGGVIGGKNQSGRYRMDARFNKENLINRLESIARVGNRVSVSNLDAVDFMKDVCSRKNESGLLLYLDPPYYEKAEQLYFNAYARQDHEELARFVQSLNVPWVVTYDDCEPIRDLYSRVCVVGFRIWYSSHSSRRFGDEVAFHANLSKCPEPFIRR